MSFSNLLCPGEADSHAGKKGLHRKTHTDEFIIDLGADKIDRDGGIPHEILAQEMRYVCGVWW
jgi:hypothetical protein